MSDSNFNWAEFYMEFADKLLEYKDNRKELIDKIYNIYSTIDVNLAKLEGDDEGNPIKPYDIDPFTVFALFNKNITRENRLSIIEAIKEEFSISKSSIECSKSNLFPTKKPGNSLSKSIS